MTAASAINNKGVNILKKFLTATCFFLATSASTFAAVPTAESLDELFKVTNASALIDSIYANLEQTMQQNMVQALAGQKLTDEQKRVMESTSMKVAQIVREEITWDKLKPIYISIYQESLTQEDIDGLLAFYRSPAGDVLIKKMPAVMQKSMGAVQVLMGPLMEKIKTAVAASVSEAKKAR